MRSLPLAEDDVRPPIYLDSPGRWLILSDVHIPHHANSAIEKAVAFGRSRKANGIILNGDILDCPGLSQKHACKPNEKMLKRELIKLRKFFAYLREQFPKADIWWKLGNHEARLQPYLMTLAPALFGLESLTWSALGKCEKYGVNVIEDDTRIIRLGDIPILHGHEVYRGNSSPMQLAYSLYRKCHDSAVCGHHHRSDTFELRTIAGRRITTHTLGCLRTLTPSYAPTNQWNHGFGVASVNNRSECEFENHRI